MKKTPSIGFIDINSPVLLGLTALSLFCLLLNSLTGGAANIFMAARFTSWLDPLQYLRLFTHVIAHANAAHYFGNFLLILIVGPAVEEKYGSRNLLVMLLITSVVTGLFKIIFFRNVMLLGASGLAFMLIVLGSFTNVRRGKIPLTFILVAVYYIGGEVVTGLFGQDNISQLSHILGGVCGGIFGFFFIKRPPKAAVQE